MTVPALLYGSEYWTPGISWTWKEEILDRWNRQKRSVFRVIKCYAIADRIVSAIIRRQELTFIRLHYTKKCIKEDGRNMHVKCKTKGIGNGKWKMKRD